MQPTDAPSSYNLRLDDADLLAALRDQLARAVDRLRELRSQAIDANVADEIAEIRFFAARLGRRLRTLGQDGLLHLSVVTSQSVTDVVDAAMEEVHEECARRGIDARVEVEDMPPPMWVDREQLIEAVRCAIDDVLADTRTRSMQMTVGRNRFGRVELTLRGELSEDGSVTDGPRMAEPVLLRQEVAHRLLDLMGGDTRAFFDGQTREIVLSLPQGRPPSSAKERAREGRVYVFPTPSAA